MIEIVWSVNIMVAILIGGVGWVLYYIFTYDQKYTSWYQMAEKDLVNFLKKIEQLNKISELIKKNPVKKKELSDCKNHEEVICLTSKWGFEIGKRWGEY